MFAFNVELTDTFGDESNYSWVKIAELSSGKDTRRSIVRKAKEWAGYTGLHCKVEDFGDLIKIIPRGICHVMFITYD